MRKIKVFHQIKSDFMTVTTFDREKFTLVAEVAVNPTGDDIGDLERAYRDTNHIDCPWWENPGVTCLVGSRKVRSTSMGDVMEMDGQTFAVDICGFAKL